MNQQRKNAKRLATKVAAGTLAATLTFGNIAAAGTPVVYAAETLSEDINLESFDADVEEIIASLPYGGDVSDTVQGVIVTVAGEDKIIGVIEDAEEKIEEEALLDSEETDAATSEMDKAEEKIEEVKDVVAEAEDIYGNIDGMEFVSSEDAKAAVEELTVAEQTAKAAYAEAEEALGIAKENLDEAQAEYEAAKAISEEAAEEAAAKLEAAKAKLAKAEEVAKAANDHITEVQGLLNKVSDRVSEFEDKTDAALEEAQGKLEESKENLDNAIENVETENEEFNAAIDEFKEKYDSFVEAANNFYEAIEDAQAKEEALESLYAEYEATQAALEAAKAAYADEQAKCEELGYEFEEDYFANFEEYITELEAAMESAEETMNTAETEKDKAEDTKAAYETEDAKAYEEVLNEYRDTLKDEEASQEDKDAAALAAAKLIIEKELAAGQTVEWIPAGESEYGKSATGFYVVLDAEGNLVERYGYRLESSSVDIYQMTGSGVVNYVIYNGVEYPLTKEDDGTLTITVGEETIVVNAEVKEGSSAYYVEDIVETAEVEITTEDPVSVDLSEIGYDGDYFKIEGNAEDGYYVSVDLKYITLKIDLVKAGDEFYYVTYEKEYKCDNTSKGHSCFFSRCESEQVEVRINVPVSYPTKTQIVYGDSQYDLVTAENGTMYIDVNGTQVVVYATTDENGNVTYTTRNNTTYVPGGTADTTFEIGGETNKNSDTYANAKNEAVNNYNDKLGIYNEKVTAYNNAVDNFNASNAVFEELTEAHTALNGAETKAEEKDLGAMAELPKNVSEMVEGLDAEQTKALLEAVGELVTSEEVDYKAVLDVLTDVVDADAAARLIYVMGYDTVGDAMGDSVLGGIFDFIMGGVGEAIDAPSEYEREYANAWVDALMAKINVVKAAADVVDATNETITAGLNVINAGTDLGDAAIDALLARVEESILSGTVETLVVAADVLDVSEKIVVALTEKIDALQAETQDAYDAVVEAQNTLNALELTNPKAEELAKAEQVLADATERYNKLTEALEATKAELATAEGYKDAAQAQYDALTKPAEGDTPVLPMPGVTPEVPSEPTEPSTPSVPSEPEEPSAPSVPTVPSYPEFDFNFNTTTEETTTIVDEETPLAGGFNKIATATPVDGTENAGKFIDKSGKLIVSAVVRVSDGTLYIVDEKGNLVTMRFSITEDTYTMYFTDENGVMVTRTFIAEKGNKYVLIPKLDMDTRTDITIPQDVVYYAGKKGNIIVDREVTMEAYTYTFDEEGIITKQVKVK